MLWPHLREDAAGVSMLDLVIQADAVFIVGAHFAAGDGDMGRMGGVALECLGRLKGGVQHQVGGGGGGGVKTVPPLV